MVNWNWASLRCLVLPMLIFTSVTHVRLPGDTKYNIYTVSKPSLSDRLPPPERHGGVLRHHLLPRPHWGEEPQEVHALRGHPPHHGLAQHGRLENVIYFGLCQSRSGMQMCTEIALHPKQSNVRYSEINHSIPNIIFRIQIIFIFSSLAVAWLYRCSLSPEPVNGKINLTICLVFDTMVGTATQRFPSKTNDFNPVYYQCPRHNRL